MASASDWLHLQNESMREAARRKIDAFYRQPKESARWQLEEAVKQTGLFWDATAAERVRRHVVPLRLLLRQQIVTEPGSRPGRTVGVFLAILCPAFWLFHSAYTEWGPPLELHFALDVIGAPEAGGKEFVLASYRTSTWSEFEAQANADEDMIPLVLNERRVQAIGVLVTQLTRDPLLPGKVRDLFAAPPPSFVHAPPPHSPALAPSPAPAPPPAPAPAPVTIPPRPPPPGDVFVLVVGVGAYQDPAIPPLPYAGPDAQAVYGFFAAERRSPTRADRVLLLKDAEASRTAILRAVREHLALKATEPGDTALLYFAGHGFADASTTYLAAADTMLASLPETGSPRPRSARRGGACAPGGRSSSPTRATRAASRASAGSAA
jgi:hypothetical protein